MFANYIINAISIIKLIASFRGAERLRRNSSAIRTNPDVSDDMWQHFHFAAIKEAGRHAHCQRERQAEAGRGIGDQGEIADRMAVRKGVESKPSAAPKLVRARGQSGAGGADGDLREGGLCRLHAVLRQRQRRRYAANANIRKGRQAPLLA